MPVQHHVLRLTATGGCLERRLLSGVPPSFTPRRTDQVRARGFRLARSPSEGAAEVPQPKPPRHVF
jgi:hypothetical protein